MLFIDSLPLSLTPTPLGLRGKRTRQRESDDRFCRQRDPCYVPNRTLVDSFRARMSDTRKRTGLQGKTPPATLDRIERHFEPGIAIFTHSTRAEHVAFYHCTFWQNFDGSRHDRRIQRAGKPISGAA